MSSEARFVKAMLKKCDLFVNLFSLRRAARSRLGSGRRVGEELEICVELEKSSAPAASWSWELDFN